MLTHSVLSNSLWPHGPWPILCPWDFSGKNIEVDCHFLFPGIFPTNPMDWGAWWVTVHGVAKIQTWLSHFTSLHFPTQGSNPRLHISCTGKWILYHWATCKVLTSLYSSKILGWGSRNCLCIMVSKGVPFGMGHQGKKVTNKSVSLLGLRSRNCETVRSRKCLHILSTSPADSSTRLSTYMSVSYICSYFGVNRCININYLFPKFARIIVTKFYYLS